MNFDLIHRTTYRYSLPVTLGEHRLRLLPRSDGRQRLIDHLIAIDPPPLRMSSGLDAWGNRIELVRFGVATEVLEIRVSMSVATLERPAWPVGADIGVPPCYGSEAAALTPFMGQLDAPDVLDPFVEPLLRLAQGSLTAFLEGLNARVHGFYHRGVRLEGPARSAGQTIQRGEGVCRDLTLLFMAACRRLGIASRFVSGYQQGGASQGQRYLHAWPEIYLPHSGWQGYDPTHNTPVGSAHVAIASAGVPGDTTPVEGGYTFQGASLTSTLETDIRISTVS